MRKQRFKNEQQKAAEMVSPDEGLTPNRESLFYLLIFLVALVVRARSAQGTGLVTVYFTRRLFTLIF